MLSVPFKKTSASIDLAGPLRRYLIKEFPKEETEKFSDDLTELQRIRATATQVEQPSDEARELLLRYAGQLAALEAVFPVSETEVRVGFKWGDAFNPNKKSTQSTLLFERACVLYNFGAHESSSASQEDRSGEVGLKAACHRFQVASGVFQYIRENVVGGLVGTLTQDLIPDGLSAASVLMLAQAQACFYEKAVKDRVKTKLKPTIIAKLASKAGEFYTQVLGYMQGPNLAPGLDRSWPAHVEFQSISFAASSYYWESVARNEVADETGSGYGLEIAYLQKASEMLKQAFHLAQRQALSSTFTASATTLNANITKTLSSRVKDNSTIYMEPVPGQLSVKPIPGACMVKTLPFVEGGGSHGPKLFDGLLSKSAKAALEEYKKKEAEAVGALEASAKEKTTEARSQLAADGSVNEGIHPPLRQVGLPGTVEAHESVEGVPESVWKKVQTVKQGGGGIAELREKVAEVEGSAERARSTIETVERTLDQDERLDEGFRKRYHGEYEGMSTRELGGDLRRDVEHYRGLWRTARQADAKVMGRIEVPENKEGLELLELSRKGLDEAMPAGRGAGADNGGKVHTEALSAKLVELASLLADRDAKLTALTDFVKNRNVASELAKAGRSGGGGPEAYHGAVTLALEQLAPYRDDIEANMNIQGPLLAEILTLNERFQQARASDQSTLDREAFLQKVHSSVMMFHEVHAQLSEGSMFYSDLLQRLAQLNQTCEDLVYTQGLQRREFEVGYTHRRERALQEGEDASLELARQMQAQAGVTQGHQNAAGAPGGAPAPPAKPASAGYPSVPTGGAYGQVPWSAFKPGQQQQPAPPAYHPSMPGGSQVSGPTAPTGNPHGEPGANPYGQPRVGAPSGAHNVPAPGQQQPQQPAQGYTAAYNTLPPPSVAQQSFPGAPSQQHGGYTPAGYGAAAPAPAASSGNAPAGYGAGAPAPAAQHGAAPAPSRPGGRWGAWLTGGRGDNQGMPQAAPAVPGGSSGPTDPNEAKYNRLLEMGFDPSRVRAALAETKGDEEAAVGKLLSQ